MVELFGIQTNDGGETKKIYLSSRSSMIGLLGVCIGTRQLVMKLLNAKRG